MFENRKIYESNLEAQLAQWKADIDVLKAKAKRSKVEAMVQYDHSIDVLQHKHVDATLKLRKLRIASDDAWESVKESTEKVWGEFASIFRKSAK